jgi:hypothetical protein
MSAIRQKIEARLDELEALMKARNYAEAEELIPSITNFTSVLTEEQRDFMGAVRLQSLRILTGQPENHSIKDLKMTN